MFKPEEFFDTKERSDHASFQKWRQRNDGPIGFVINCGRSIMLHHSNCRHFGKPVWKQEEVGASLTRVKKICSSKLREFEGWAKKANIKYVECSHCSNTLHNARKDRR